ELVGADRRDFLLDGRGGARTAGLQKRLGIERRAAARADHLLAHQIIIAGAAARADPLGAPFGFGHGGSSVISTIGRSARHCHSGRGLSKAIAAGTAIWAAAPASARGRARKPDTRPCPT